MSIRTALMAAAAIAAGAGLAACQRNQPQVAALPLDTGAAQPLGEAPPPGGLPPAPPAPIATLADYHDAYAFPDRAWGMSWAFGDSPPDYGFYDDGVSPWVWSRRRRQRVPGRAGAGRRALLLLRAGRLHAVLRAGSELRLRLRERPAGGDLCARRAAYPAGPDYNRRGHRRPLPGARPHPAAGCGDPSPPGGGGSQLERPSRPHRLRALELLA